MTELEKKKKMLELGRVKLARQEMEFKIEEKQDEIKRLQDFIKIQLDKEQELEKELVK